VIRTCTINADEVIKALNEEQISILATCADNKVTIQPMSHINEDLNVYFQAGKNSLKVGQISENPNVAICVGTYEIEGTASEAGHPMAEGNVFFARAYKEKHPGSYEQYSKLEEETVIKVTVKRVRQWRYINSQPFLAESEF